ncbi:CU044_5270 family protein [Nonomuraea sp. SBT364]|uniref:CU044_5270 family protein n=1 Tax=Nonomuraea sp. SBT364 TaxID=1580530 RepID=UPI00066E8092|nr:CU044_5270 family protein [Nonomuraea sp. SBT364]
MDDLSAVRELLSPPGPSRETVVRGRDRLLTEIAHERPPSRTPHDRPGRRAVRAARWGTFGLASAAAAAAVVLSSAPPAEPPPPDARTVLLAAATSAARQPAEGAWWGNKLVRGVRFRDPGDRYTLQQTATEETWLPTGKMTAPHWIVLRYLGVEPATPEDEAAWRADGSPTRWSYPYGNGGGLGGDSYEVEAAPGEARSIRQEDVDWRLLAAGRPLTRMAELPATPEGLRALLGPGTGELTANLGSFVLEMPVPAETRAAAYRLMASLPGVTARGEVTDQLGRTGQAIVYRDPADDRDKRLIFNVATGAPLALETLMPSGEPAQFTAVAESVWTDQLPDLPNPEPEGD